MFTDRFLHLAEILCCVFCMDSGCSTQTNPPGEQNSVTQRVNEEDVLKIAEAELSRRGVNNPDEDIQKSLKAVGFETTLNAIDGGWHVVYFARGCGSSGATGIECRFLGSADEEAVCEDAIAWKLFRNPFRKASRDRDASRLTPRRQRSQSERSLVFDLPSLSNDKFGTPNHQDRILRKVPREPDFA